MEHKSREWWCTQLQFFCLKIQLNQLMQWNVLSLVVSERGAFISNAMWGLWYVQCLQIATVRDSGQYNAARQWRYDLTLSFEAIKLFISIYNGSRSVTQ
jgi:hypothetical protein